jgi:hypothetical protein
VRFAPINNASLNIEMALLSNSNFSMERYERKCPHRWDSGGVFWERQTVLWSLPVLLLLSSCGSAGPECDSFDTRNSVVKIVSDDSNNALVDYAAKNSSVIGARVNKASTEAERLAIWETARQGASYRLGAIGTNPKSKDRRAVNCSGVLSVTVEDATAEKQVDFKIEQMPDGKVSVSVSPFQF